VLTDLYAHHYAEAPPGEEVEDPDFARGVSELLGAPDDWEEVPPRG
jgi:hypothetical protein